MSTRPILISGASGVVGARLVRDLDADGLPVQRLSRTPLRLGPGPGTPVGWDGTRFPKERLGECGAVVHLSGEPIFGGLPTAARRRRMWESRIASTRSLVEGLEELPAAERPAVLICASAVGIYGAGGGEEPLTEDAPPGQGFLAELCVAWEAEAQRAAASGVRVVSLRFGIILAREGGALAMLRRLFALGLGGRLGDGQQWSPFIHAADAVGLVRLALEDEGLSGPVNAVAPEPVRNAELTIQLARALHRPAVFAVPAFAIRGALGPLAGEFLDSRRVIPARASEAGFSWRAPRLEDALAAELGPAR